MRTIRSLAQWQTIIEDQQTSGLAIRTYCQQHQLSTTSFYAFRKKLGLSSGNFVRAKVTQQMEVIEEQLSISITLGKATVSLPTATTATYLSQLLREFV